LIFAKVLPDATLNKEELFEYWKSFAHRSGPRNFLTVLHHGSIGHFAQFGSHLLKTDRICTKILL